MRRRGRARKGPAKDELLFVRHARMHAERSVHLSRDGWFLVPQPPVHTLGHHVRIAIVLYSNAPVQRFFLPKAVTKTLTDVNAASLPRSHARLRTEWSSSHRTEESSGGTHPRSTQRDCSAAAHRPHPHRAAPHAPLHAAQAWTHDTHHAPPCASRTIPMLVVGTASAAGPPQFRRNSSAILPQFHPAFGAKPLTRALASEFAGLA